MHGTEVGQQYDMELIVESMAESSRRIKTFLAPITNDHNVNGVPRRDELC